MLLIKVHFFLFFAGEKQLRILILHISYRITILKKKVKFKLFNIVFNISALGPILPFLFVTGKQLGISDMAMGFIFSIIPVFYFVSKSLYGFVLDYYTRQRTFIFTITIAMMGLFYSLIYFVPNTLQNKEFTSNISCSSVSFCDLHVTMLFYCVTFNK